MKGGDASDTEAAAAADEGVEPLVLFLKSEMMSARIEWGLVEGEVEGVVEAALAEAARGAASTVVAESSIWKSLRCQKPWRIHEGLLVGLCRECGAMSGSSKGGSSAMYCHVPTTQRW